MEFFFVQQKILKGDKSQLWIFQGNISKLFPKHNLLKPAE